MSNKKNTKKGTKAPKHAFLNNLDGGNNKDNTNLQKAILNSL